MEGLLKLIITRARKDQWSAYKDGHSYVCKGYQAYIHQGTIYSHCVFLHQTVLGSSELNQNSSNLPNYKNLFASHPLTRFSTAATYSPGANWSGGSVFKLNQNARAAGTQRLGSLVVWGPLSGHHISSCFEESPGNGGACTLQWGKPSRSFKWRCFICYMGHANIVNVHQATGHWLLIRKFFMPTSYSQANDS